MVVGKRVEAVVALAARKEGAGETRLGNHKAGAKFATGYLAIGKVCVARNHLAAVGATQSKRTTVAGHRSGEKKENEKRTQCTTVWVIFVEYTGDGPLQPVVMYETSALEPSWMLLLKHASAHTEHCGIVPKLPFNSPKSWRA